MTKKQQPGINHDKKSCPGVRIAATLLVLLLSRGLCAAQDTWKLKTESGGIKIFMRSVPNSAVKALKVECSISASPSQLVAVILDLDACDEWVYKSKSNILIKRVSPSELFYYSEVDVPWPAQNRDFIAHLIVHQNSKNKVVTVDAPCDPDMLPKKKDIVRIPRSSGRWTITPTGKNALFIEYELAVDPGGSIPAWLINMFATKGPLETFRKLKLQVQKPEYKKAHFDFITD
jgi:hypothetical protein